MTAHKYEGTQTRSKNITLFTNVIIIDTDQVYN